MNRSPLGWVVLSVSATSQLVTAAGTLIRISVITAGLITTEPEQDCFGNGRGTYSCAFEGMQFILLGGHASADLAFDAPPRAPL